MTSRALSLFMMSQESIRHPYIATFYFVLLLRFLLLFVFIVCNTFFMFSLCFSNICQFFATCSFLSHFFLFPFVGGEEGACRCYPPPSLACSPKSIFHENSPESHKCWAFFTVFGLPLFFFSHFVFFFSFSSSVFSFTYCLFKFSIIFMFRSFLVHVLFFPMFVSFLIHFHFFFIFQPSISFSF